MRELLSDKGSIYLHTDYKIGHYLKVMMDEVFGMENFRNDITRVKCNPKNFNRIGFGNEKDMILFYTKSSGPIWHEPREPYSEKDIETLFRKTVHHRSHSCSRRGAKAQNVQRDASAFGQTLENGCGNA